MSSDFDESEFIDKDFQSARRNPYTPATAHAQAAPAPVPAHRAPTREEVDHRVTEAQNKLAQLKQVQADLERERSRLEDTRRKQNEYSTGRAEIVEHLTRGIGLLEEAEFAARRDAEEMSKVLAAFREAQAKINAINEQTWTSEDFMTELTRANTVIENARMEWNSARLKFPILSGENAPTSQAHRPATPDFLAQMQQRSFGEQCLLGLALTWPIAIGAIGILLVLLFR